MPTPPQIIGHVVSGMRGSCAIKRQGQSALSWGRRQEEMCHRSSPDKWGAQEGRKGEKEMASPGRRSSTGKVIEATEAGSKTCIRHCVHGRERRV